MRGQVLDVEQLQGDTRAPQLLVQPRQVRLRAAPVDRLGQRAVQQALQGLVAERLDRRPRQGSGARPADRRRHGAGAHAETPGGFPMAPLGDPLQSQDFSNVPHG